MQLCKNGRSVHMGFQIYRKSDGQAVANVCAVVPIDRMDDPNAWWLYGVNAYLHDRQLPTHMDERSKYTAKPTADFQTRHKFVEEAQAERAAAVKPMAKRRRRSSKQVFPNDACQFCGYTDPQHDQGVSCPNCA